MRLIRQRRRDSLTNGAVWGFVTGGVFGVVVGLLVAPELGAEVIPIFGAVYGGIGSGTGVAVDALVKGQQVVYAGPAHTARRLAVSPIVAGETRGFSLSFSF